MHESQLAASATSRTEHSRTALRWLPVVALCVAAAWLVAAHGNQDVFIALNQWARALPEPFWSCITILGTGACAYALLSFSLVRSPRLMAAALMTGAFAGIYTHAIKPLARTARPAGVLAPEQIHIIGETLTSNSFPSGHSVTAFAFAGLLTFFFARPGRVALVAIPLAALVALSRIAVGAHWPIDTLAGAAGGWVCGMAGEALSRRWTVWTRKPWRIAFALAMIGLSVGLATSNLGYPQAIPLQWALAALAFVGGAIALRHALTFRTTL